MAARETGGLSLADALLLCELVANADPSRYKRAGLRWLQRFIDKHSAPLTEVALAASEARRATLGTAKNQSARWLESDGTCHRPVGQ
jgi:hypothetical protein